MARGHRDRSVLSGSALTQADVTTAVMLDFTRIVNPDLVAANLYPSLTAHGRRCNALQAFAETFPADEVDQANPTLPGTE